MEMEDPAVSHGAPVGSGPAPSIFRNSLRKLLEQNLLPLGLTFVSVQLSRERRLCALQGEEGSWSGGTCLGVALTLVVHLLWTPGGVWAATYLGAGGIECVSATAQPPGVGPRVRPGL